MAVESRLSLKIAGVLDRSSGVSHRRNLPYSYAVDGVVADNGKRWPGVSCEEVKVRGRRCCGSRPD